MKREVPRIGLAVLEWSILVAIVSLAGAALLAPSRAMAGEAPAASADAGQALSEAAATTFQRKLMELSNSSSSSPKSLSSVVLTDTEVNSYLKYDRPPFLPAGLTDLEIHFKPEGIYGGSNVNFDTLQPAEQSANDLTSRVLSSIFRGNQRVTALAKIASNNGTATLTIQDVHVGSVALSDWLVNWLIQTYVESQYKIDLSKPFLLPAHVTQIEFAPGKAIFVRGRK